MITGRLVSINKLHMMVIMVIEYLHDLLKFVLITANIIMIMLRDHTHVMKNHRLSRDQHVLPVVHEDFILRLKKKKNYIKKCTGIYHVVLNVIRPINHVNVGTYLIAQLHHDCL